VPLAYLLLIPGTYGGFLVCLPAIKIILIRNVGIVFLYAGFCYNMKTPLDQSPLNINEGGCTLLEKEATTAPGYPDHNRFPESPGPGEGNFQGPHAGPGILEGQGFF
jgi:hypothetical protein